MTRCHEGCYLHKCCVPQSRLLVVTHLSVTLVLFLSPPQFSKTLSFFSGLSSPLGRKLKNKILGHVLPQHLMLAFVKAFVSSYLQFFPSACSTTNLLSVRISSQKDRTLCSLCLQNLHQFHFLVPVQVLLSCLCVLNMSHFHSMFFITKILSFLHCVCMCAHMHGECGSHRATWRSQFSPQYGVQELNTGPQTQWQVHSPRVTKHVLYVW